jgi:glycosyltransferase involved in cell wall biosynthesis
MSRPRRFAFVTPNFYPRTCGVADFSMRLGQELQRRGMAVKIFSRAPAETNPEGRDIAVAGVDGPTPLVIAARLQKEIEAFAPTDVVIHYTAQMFGASRFGSPATLYLAQAARRAGVNTVLLAHELYLPFGRRPDLIVGPALLRAQLALLMRLCHRVLVTMEMRIDELAPLARAVGVSRRAGVVRVGTAALPLPRVPVPGRLRLGLFSTLANTKRFDVVLEGFEAVRARHPHAELVLIGDLGGAGNPSFRALSDAIARQPGHDRIRVTGKLALGDIAREVAALDIYLFPMIWGANTRTSTLPLALGAGVPSVATRSFETDAIFVGDENIVFADAMTGEAFGRAALRLADDAALAARVAAGGRALYDAHLAWNRVADQFLAQS